ncbi:MULTISPECIES: DJ-1/PfpI family protein [unclassified Streptomyces]|uniref:DJ-1/PfpI family protein n=1 Tax=unclassified Streptomyces TaxID=2593676 RepID=UPI002E75DFC9|nr:DJ-1/PfpI family protein [Streptomyces sp. JV176]MEE1801124.1 DJ-1/PfpI family protein [Streptomyces sp. JV176]
MERRHFLHRTTAAGAAVMAGGAMTATAVSSGPATATPRRTAPLRVDIVMFDGVEELDCIAPHSVFSNGQGRAEVRYVTTGRPGLIRSAHGIGFQVEQSWSPEKADVIVVPGGGYVRPEGAGVWAEIKRGVLPRALAAASRKGLTISSVCTGAMLLSAAGLTKERPCTTHHLAKAELEAQGGLVKSARVVDDGDLVTAGGVSSGLELGLWLFKRELGSDAVLEVEKILEYEPRGTVWTARPST